VRREFLASVRTMTSSSESRRVLEAVIPE